MAEKETNGLNRREFLRKAAITGAVAWAIPVVQSVAATPAFAQGTPICVHGQCVSACRSVHTGEGACDQDRCETACDALCRPTADPGGARRCCIQACSPANWVETATTCTFVGSTVGCPPPS